jgi:hypothetical protein
LIPFHPSCGSPSQFSSLYFLLAEWCENKILLGAGCSRYSSAAAYAGDADGTERDSARTSSTPSPCPCPTPSSSALWGLRRILRNHLEIEEQDEEEEEEKEEKGSGRPKDIENAHTPSPHSVLDPVTLGMYFKRENVSAGEIVFDVGHRAHKVYFIEEGSVEILLVPEAPATPKAIGVSGGVNGGVKGAATGSGGGQRAERVNKISSGGIFGEAAFFMDLPQRSVRD